MAQVSMTETAERWIRAEDARKMLGVGRNKMAKLLASTTLPWRPSTLDGRVKLVKLQDVERLQEELGVEPSTLAS